jgi:hypothetical protein
VPAGSTLLNACEAALMPAAEPYGGNLSAGRKSRGSLEEARQKREAIELLSYAKQPV